MHLPFRGCDEDRHARVAGERRLQVGARGPSARRVAELRRPLGDDLVHGVTQPVERLVDGDT
eukprot:scaffold128675_cov57-Phaeocystis_antarctica.AAC.2